MWHNRHRSLRVVLWPPSRSWLSLIVCMSFFLTVTVLLPIHQCVHHNNVLGLIGTCNCPCHTLTTALHQRTSTLPLVGLVANAFLSEIDLGTLPFRSLEYHPALQRAPPLPTV